MDYVNVFVSEQDALPLVLALARSEIFHPADTIDGGSERTEGPWTDLAESYAGQKQRLQKILDVLSISPPELPAPGVVHPMRDREVIEDRLKDIEAQIGKLSDHRKQTEEQIDHLDYLIREVRMIAPAGMPVETAQRKRN